jgi:hypothetical protein
MCIYIYVTCIYTIIDTIIYTVIDTIIHHILTTLTTPIYIYIYTSQAKKNERHRMQFKKEINGKNPPFLC